MAPVWCIVCGRLLRDHWVTELRKCAEKLLPNVLTEREYLERQLCSDAPPTKATE
jgi:DNA-directed RNA polymerase subunit N (RpoN/RPB10)